jgi:hypothetical protein
MLNARRSARWMMLPVLVALAGCGAPAVVQVETVIRSDGSCERTIWQPREELLPEQALTREWSDRWNSIRPVKVPPFFAQQQPDGGDRRYFTASGRFHGPDEIPEHYRVVARGHPEVGASTLVHSYRRNDLGFVIEHRWTENLTNIVTRAGFLKARDQFLDRAIPWASRGLEEVYGEKYDVQGLVRYLSGEGRRFLEDLSLVAYENMARRLPDDEWGVRLAEAARLRGVDLFDSAGKFAWDEERNQRLHGFLRHRVLLGIRRRDGRGLAPSEIEAILTQSETSPYSRAWKTFWERHEAELDRELGPSILRMTGLYGWPPLSAPGSPKFAFTIALPGEVVETNGSRAGPGRVAWSFDAGQAFPDGFAMSARSLEIDRKAQQRLLGRVPVDDASKARVFCELLDSEPELQLRLREFIKSGDNRCLDDAASTPKDGENRPLRELQRLLK